MHLKSLFPISLFLVFHLSIVNAQQAESQWGGTIEYGGQLNKLVITFFDNSQLCNLTNYSNSSEALPVKIEVRTPKMLHLKINEEIEYIGSFSNDSIISGHLIIQQDDQLAAKLELNFRKLGENDPLVQVPRPQTPKPPYPYITEDVTFINNSDEISLCGTISKPNTGGPFPAVIIVSGSGRDNRDGEEDLHKRWLVLGDFLTKNGFLVLRFDEREVGCSDGDFDSATTLDLKNDVLAGVEFLMSRSDVASNNIGVIGHSEGAIIAPIIANELENKISYLILMGTPAKPLSIIKNEFYKSLLLLQGTEEKEIDDYLDFINKVDDIIRKHKDKKDAILAIKKLNEDTILNPNAFVQSISELEGGTLSDWYLFLLDYDPLENFRRIQCPILFLHGTEDINVNLSHLHLLKAFIKRENPKLFPKCTFLEIPKANHFLQTDTLFGGNPYRIIDIEETFSNLVFVEILAFLKKINPPTNIPILNPKEIKFLKGYVVDEDKNPISFAHIIFGNNSLGATTDINGCFYLNYEKRRTSGDILIFSAVGFETRKIPFDSISFHNHQAVISLEKKSYELNEINFNSIKKRKVRLGSKTSTSLINYDAEANATSSLGFANFFKVKSRKQFQLTDVGFYLRETTSKSDSIKIRLNIYQANNDSVGNQINIDPITFDIPNKPGWYRIKIEKSLVILNESFFAELEILPLKEDPFIISFGGHFGGKVLFLRNGREEYRMGFCSYSMYLDGFIFSQ